MKTQPLKVPRKVCNWPSLRWPWGGSVGGLPMSLGASFIRVPYLGSSQMAMHPQTSLSPGVVPIAGLGVDVTKGSPSGSSCWCIPISVTLTRISERYVPQFDDIGHGGGQRGAASSCLKPGLFDPQVRVQTHPRQRGGHVTLDFLLSALPKKHHPSLCDSCVFHLVNDRAHGSFATRFGADVHFQGVAGTLGMGLVPKHDSQGGEVPRVRSLCSEVFPGKVA